MSNSSPHDVTTAMTSLGGRTFLELHYNLMGPRSYMQFVVDQRNLAHDFSFLHPQWIFLKQCIIHSLINKRYY